MKWPQFVASITISAGITAIVITAEFFLSICRQAVSGYFGSLECFEQAAVLDIIEIQ